MMTQFLRYSSCLGLEKNTMLGCSMTSEFHFSQAALPKAWHAAGLSDDFPVSLKFVDASPPIFKKTKMIRT